MITLPPTRLKDIKITAQLLHKALQSSAVSGVAPPAGALFHPSVQYVSFYNQLMAGPERIRLKDAYHLLAIRYGFGSWNALRDHIITEDCLYRKNAVAFVYAWFKTYAKARVYHRKNGGYLLRFWNDFVVCGDEYIGRLNLLDYPDHWQRIGHNWVEPQDTTARQFLYGKAVINYVQFNK